MTRSEKLLEKLAEWDNVPAPDSRLWGHAPAVAEKPPRGFLGNLLHRPMSESIGNAKETVRRAAKSTAGLASDALANSPKAIVEGLTDKMVSSIKRVGNVTPAEVADRARGFLSRAAHTSPAQATSAASEWTRRALKRLLKR